MNDQTLKDESVFAVTTEPRMEIGAERRGKATVTVSNRSGRTFDAVRARVVPEGEADSTWFHLEQPVRRMAPGALEQFVVEVRLPKDAPPGEHRFRLHVADEAIPDDHFATSPSVAFTAPAAEKEEKSRWPLWAAIAALVLLVVALGTLFADDIWADPELGDACDGTCSPGLTCEAGFCVGRVGFEGCRYEAHCADGLLCSGGRCAGDLGFEGCDEPGRPCGDELACEDGTCRGALGFAGCRAGEDDCAGDLACRGGTCSEATSKPPPPRPTPPPPAPPTLSFREDCQRHDPGSLAVRSVRGNWTIVQGRRSLLSFADQRDEAQRALRVLQQLGVDRTCWIGRPDPAMTYYKKGDAIPDGTSRELRCTSFDSVSLARRGGTWSLYGDSSRGGRTRKRRLATFENRTEARWALELVRVHDLNRKCTLRRERRDRDERERRTRVRDHREDEPRVRVRDHRDPDGSDSDRRRSRAPSFEIWLSG